MRENLHGSKLFSNKSFGSSIEGIFIPSTEGDFANPVDVLEPEI